MCRTRWYARGTVHQVLVLNASYEPLNVCSDRRAHVLVWKGKAEVVEHHAQPLRSAERSFVRPHVIRLLQYVRVPRAVKRRISRRALFARDGWKCVYCGTAGGRLTLDHVIPALEGRRFGLGERRHRLRALQSAQGRQAARGGLDVASPSPARTRAGALHPPRGAAGSGELAPVPALARAVRVRGRLRAFRFFSAAARHDAALAGLHGRSRRRGVAWSGRASPAASTRSRGSSGWPPRTASKR